MPIASRQAQEEQSLYSARVFRCLLDGLARPGKLNVLPAPTFLGIPPSYYAIELASDMPINLYALGALLSLLDGETRFSIAANGQWMEPSSQAVRWLTLRCGARLVEPAQADFAFFCDGKSGGLLSMLNMGTLLEPELSTTAMYCVQELREVEIGNDGRETVVDAINRPLHSQKGLEDAINRSLRLTGPGIQGSRVVSVVGLGERELEFIQSTRQQYPLGIDVYLIGAAGQCLGLPRTTRVQAGIRG